MVGVYSSHRASWDKGRDGGRATEGKEDSLGMSWGRLRSRDKAEKRVEGRMETERKKLGNEGQRKWVKRRIVKLRKVRYSATKKRKCGCWGGC